MEFETKDSGKRQEFPSGMKRDSEDKPLYTEMYFPLLKRYGELMQRGAKKYGRGNWRKACSAEELQRFKDSLLRHTMQYLNGESDEDHLSAILFNAQGCAMVEDKLKEIEPMINKTESMVYDELERAITVAVYELDTKKE